MYYTAVIQQIFGKASEFIDYKAKLNPMGSAL